MNAREVTSRNELVEFLESLASEARGNVEGVDNSSASELIDGASAWLADLEGYFRNQQKQTPEYPTWSLIAMTFQAALHYE